MRRSHKKSRYGCKDCRRRHIKCDETRPSCVNCKTVNRPCSFLDIVSRLPSRPSTNLISSTKQNPTTTSEPIAAPGLQIEVYLTAQCRLSNTIPTISSRYHIQLLHHFTTHMVSHVAADKEQGQRLLAMAGRHAVQGVAPHLTYQVLALSAMHMSMLRPEAEKTYRHDAMRLQTRALAIFNGSTDSLSGANALPTFLFSIILAYQTMLEALQAAQRIGGGFSDFSDFLPKLVQWFKLAGGIRIIAEKLALAAIDAHSTAQGGISFMASYNDLLGIVGTKPEYLELLKRIEEADLSETSMQACLEAAHVLHRLHVFIESPESPLVRRANFLMQWPSSVSPQYVDLIEKRRPESLVIIAHYAVLIHGLRHEWSFGSAGRSIIEAIDRYLGPAWSDRLAWPLSMLEGNKNGNQTESTRELRK